MAVDLRSAGAASGFCVGVFQLPQGSTLVTQPFPAPFLSPLKTMASCIPQKTAEEPWAHGGLISYLAIWPFRCSTAAISEQVIRNQSQMHTMRLECDSSKWMKTNSGACLSSVFIDNDNDRWRRANEGVSVRSWKGHSGLRFTNCSVPPRTEERQGLLW